MPHTWIVWVHAQIVHSHIAIQEMSVIRHPTVLKTSTFSCKDNENTFNMSAILFEQHYKIKNIFLNEQHSLGHCLGYLVKTTKNPTYRMSQVTHPDGCQGISW